MVNAGVEPPGATSDGRFQMLVICTANRCRSPLAEVIIRDAFERRGVVASVGSAGVLPGGHPAEPGSQWAARHLGFDLSTHSSRQVTAAMIDAADIVVTMEASHVLDLVSVTPGCRSRTLTLRELALRAEDDSGTDVFDLDRLLEWIRAAADRPLSALLTGDLDIEDPIGRPRRAFRTTARDIGGLVDVVFDRWFGPAVDD